MSCDHIFEKIISLRKSYRFIIYKNGFYLHAVFFSTKMPLIQITVHFYSDPKKTLNRTTFWVQKLTAKMRNSLVKNIAKIAREMLTLSKVDYELRSKKKKKITSPLI